MKTTRVSDSDIDRYLERAAHRTQTTGMVAEGIKIIEQLIREKSTLRKAAKALCTQAELVLRGSMVITLASKVDGFNDALRENEP